MSLTEKRKYATTSMNKIVIVSVFCPHFTSID